MTERIRLIEVKEDILSDNDAAAQKLREQLSSIKTFMLNLMSSPGAGKTSLLLHTVSALKKEFQIGVIEADIDSVVDAEKVAAQGVEAVQLRTGGFCHLDVGMVRKGLDSLDPEKLDLVLIENVGNLVCPAEFDTGAHKNAMILSVPEGDDKPLKYPLMFSTCDILVVNKIDYLSLSDFSLATLKERVYKLNPNIAIVEISCKTGEGLEHWTNWLRNEITALARHHTA